LRKLGHIESFVHFHKTFESGREKELEEKKKGFRGEKNLESKKRVEIQGI